jgi:hypothetical protein
MITVSQGIETTFQFPILPSSFSNHGVPPLRTHTLLTVSHFAAANPITSLEPRTAESSGLEERDIST